MPRAHRSAFPKRHALWEDVGLFPAAWEIWELDKDMNVREDTWWVPELHFRELFHKTGRFITSGHIQPAAHSILWVVDGIHSKWSNASSILPGSGRLSTASKEWLEQRNGHIYSQSSLKSYHRGRGRGSLGGLCNVHHPKKNTFLFSQLEKDLKTTTTKLF